MCVVQMDRTCDAQEYAGMFRTGQICLVVGCGGAHDITPIQSKNQPVYSKGIDGNHQALR